MFRIINSLSTAHIRMVTNSRQVSFSCVCVLIADPCDVYEHTKIKYDAGSTFKRLFNIIISVMQRNLLSFTKSYHQEEQS